MAIGVRPEITLAKNAGLETARGIIVNQKMQTSNPDIYAGGDGVEIKDFVTGENTLIPLAGPANRQGRIIADNICGIESAYKNSQGTSVLKVFDLTAAIMKSSLNLKIFLIGRPLYSQKTMPAIILER